MLTANLRILKFDLREMIAEMDICRLQATRSNVLEFVRHVGRPHQNIACRCLDLLISNREQRPSRSNDKYLIVSVNVPDRTGTDFIGRKEQYGYIGTDVFAFEAAAWYWHFVDVVWLFLFAFVYVWGT